MENPQKETHCKQNPPSGRGKTLPVHEFHKIDKDGLFLPQLSAYREKIYRNKRFMMRKFITPYFHKKTTASLPVAKMRWLHWGNAVQGSVAFYSYSTRKSSATLSKNR